MSTTQVSSESGTGTNKPATIDMKLEVVTLLLQEITARIPGREWDD